jgi:hypothetical protein
MHIRMEEVFPWRLRRQTSVGEAAGRRNRSSIALIRFDLAAAAEMPHPVAGPLLQKCRKNTSKTVEDLPMITAIVHFKLPATVDAAKAAELFHGTAPKYQGLAGLVRKYYLFDAESRTGGGCYLWESREAAERLYDAEWREMITERYGAAPDISFFETPVIVDNSIGKTILDAAE